MTVRELNKRMQAVPLHRLTMAAIKLNEQEMLDMNRAQLQDHGIDSEGNDIWRRQPYTIFTQIEKISKGQPHDRVTLKDTGAFHKAFYMDVSSRVFNIDSRDSKSSSLKEKYGAEIFGLTPQNEQRAKEKNTRTLGRIWKEMVGLKGK